MRPERYETKKKIIKSIFNIYNTNKYIDYKIKNNNSNNKIDDINHKHAHYTHAPQQLKNSARWKYTSQLWNNDSFKNGRDQP
jgi:hypothetical protein